MEIVRTQKEIDDLADKCSEHQNAGTTKFRGQTYEDGIRNTLDWLAGDSDDNPMAD